MLNVFRKATAVLALVGLASIAQAADPVIGATGSYDFGVLSASRGVSVGDPVFGFSGDFDNVFSFTQASYPSVVGVLAGNDVVGDMVAQYRVGYGSTPTWLAWSALAPMPSDPAGVFIISQSYSGLTAGQKYWFEFKGSAEQAGYTITLAPAVPEPESWALLLSGLGLMGFVARRRRSLSAA